MRIFIDSGLLIEYEKATKFDLLEVLLESENQVFINPIVVSEYLYQLLGILGGRSPMSVCESGKISEVLSLMIQKNFFLFFNICQSLRMHCHWELIL
jgi:predicted nucleic acid-binding protein